MGGIVNELARHLPARCLCFVDTTKRAAVPQSAGREPFYVKPSCDALAMLGGFDNDASSLLAISCRLLCAHAGSP